MGRQTFARAEQMMQYDPHQPSPPGRIEPTGFFTGLRFRPVIAGVIVDTLATFALVTAYYTLFVAKELAARGGATEDAFAQYWNSSEGLMASLILGSLGTLIGGFYAAYNAGTLEMKHGALVGVGSIILGLVLRSGGSENDLPDWFMAISLAAAIPAGALGGFFAEMFKNMVSGGLANMGGSGPPTAGR
jgi:putative membrane protein (TIGR04086 family)